LSVQTYEYSLKDPASMQAGEFFEREDYTMSPLPPNCPELPHKKVTL